MANIGIISEFNPFHTGHSFLLSSVKGENDTVICVMSGNFVQRGDVAVLPKSERVRAALKSGADLIIELPCAYSLSRAQSFATAGVYLLKSLGVVDKIAFGSECGDIEQLTRTAALLASEEFNEKLSHHLKSGDTFAKIRTDLLSEINPTLSEVVKTPNNTLAIEYITAAKALGFNAEFATTKRQGASHDEMTFNATAMSGSFLRQHLLSGNAKEVAKYLPFLESAENVADISRLETAILASLRANNTPERYLNLPDVSEGIENRIVGAVKTATNLTELYSLVKTKRYTLSRIRRIILCAFLGITKDLPTLPPYIRVLGFTEKGKEVLKSITKCASLPVLAKASDAEKLSSEGSLLWQKEVECSDVWSLSLNNPQKCGNEYFYKIVKE